MKSFGYKFITGFVVGVLLFWTTVGIRLITESSWRRSFLLAAAAWVAFGVAELWTIWRGRHWSRR